MVKMGVLQGFIFRPLLILLFINNLPFTSSFKTILFADVAKLAISQTSMTILKQKPNLELSKVENWMKRYRFSLNL